MTLPTIDRLIDELVDAFLKQILPINILFKTIIQKEIIICKTYDKVR